MVRKRHVIRIGDHFYPRPHRRWGGCAEELLHHTSRYYHYTEAFLRNLTGDRAFELAGYRAEALNDDQRRLLAAILSLPPGPETGADCIRLVAAVRAGRETVDPDLAERYRELTHVIPVEGQGYQIHRLHEPAPPADLPPLEPFLAVAERLRLPVVVRGHLVEVPMRRLAECLDSPRPQVRVNLQNALLWLHEAGYHLRDHPGLSHREARSGECGDPG